MRSTKDQITANKVKKQNCVCICHDFNSVTLRYLQHTLLPLDTITYIYQCNEDGIFKFYTDNQITVVVTTKSLRISKSKLISYGGGI